MQRHKPDLILIGSIIFLLGLGILMMFSVSPISGYKMCNDSYYYIKRHFVYMLIGFMFFMGAYSYDYRKLKKYAGQGIILALVLLIATYLPFLRLTAGGSSRWINLGILSFQPSEIVKLLIIIYVAKIADRRREQMSDFIRGPLPIFLVVGLVVALVLLQPDLGTTLVILLTATMMLVTAGAGIWEIFILGLVGLRVISYFIMRTPYQMRRITAFIDPWKDPLNTGFNTIQSLIAVGSGGFFGVGLGQSKQKFTYLPQQYTDFMFAILCEELGFVMGAVTIVAFAVIVVRGLRIALQVEDMFGRLLAVGISFCIGIQSIINIMVVTGLSPTKGIPLPFISYGGTSLVVTLAMMGVLTQLSCYTEK